MTVEQLAARYGGKGFDYWSEGDDGKVNNLDDPRVLLQQVPANIEGDQEIEEIIRSCPLYLFPDWSAAASFREEALKAFPDLWFDLT